MRDYPGSSNDYSKVYSEKWIQNVIRQNKGKFGLSLFSSIFRSLVLLLPTLLVKQIINRSIPQENIPMLILLSCVNVSIYFVTTTLIILDLHLEKYILDAFERCGGTCTDFFWKNRCGSLRQSVPGTRSAKL